jgi:predicted pyridoxine 5'-phosphate oxidase superfamily flavin-nucleotide-binding protein
MKIPKKVKELFKSVSYMAFSTTDRKGKPNVVAIGSQKIVNKNTIWVIDTYFCKTKKNILQNNKIAIALWKDSSEGYQIKGIAKYHLKGEIFEKAKRWILEFKPNKIIKGVVEIKVTEIYYLTARHGKAGKRIL